MPEGTLQLTWAGFKIPVSFPYCCIVTPNILLGSIIPDHHQSTGVLNTAHIEVEHHQVVGLSEKIGLALVIIHFRLGFARLFHDINQPAIGVAPRFVDHLHDPRAAEHWLQDPVWKSPCRARQKALLWRIGNQWNWDWSNANPWYGWYVMIYSQWFILFNANSILLSMIFNLQITKIYILFSLCHSEVGLAQTPEGPKWDVGKQKVKVNQSYISYPRSIHIIPRTQKFLVCWSAD